MDELRTYRVAGRRREPLLRFMVEALEQSGCRILFCSSPRVAPYRLTFETPSGERMGIIAYAFTANSKLTRNRPSDEHRFQVKYGARDGLPHDLWQDPYGLYTTLFVGIDPELGIFVGADPVLHSPTKFFISIEFKRAEVEHILSSGWLVWERDRRSSDEPAEVLVGGTRESFLRYVRLEREALGEDQGHRQLLGERIAPVWSIGPALASPDATQVGEPRLHALSREFELSESEVLDLIAGARRLKMTVRGWVAEEHLVRHLRTVTGVSDCNRLDEEGGPDVRLRFENGSPLTVECKNVLRRRSGDGLPRLDFQRTRASKADPCSRYYRPEDFDVVAACLHPVTEHWEFAFALPGSLDPHRTCEGRLANNVRVDSRWNAQVQAVLMAAQHRAPSGAAR